MSNLHAAGFPPRPLPPADPRLVWARVDSVTAGQHIRRHGLVWVVCEVLPVHSPAVRLAIIAREATAPNGNGARKVLLFASPADSVELVPLVEHLERERFGDPRDLITERFTNTSEERSA